MTPGKKNVFMLVGIQGSGKTTTTAKLARYFQKRGFKTALICTDTFRPGAFAQLQQLAQQINVPVYGDEKEKNPVKIAQEGLKKFADQEVIVVDTAGRHKDEESLIKEMKLVTLLRICSLPKPIPKDTFLDVSHDGVCSWGNSKEDWK